MNGKAHAFATTLLTVGVYAASSSLPDIMQAGLTAGCAVGVLIHPDLDQAEAWRGAWVWKPYGKLFKHRGISHWPIVGTLTRVSYILAMMWVLDTIIYRLAGKSFLIWSEELLWLIVGLTIADIGHWALDLLSTRRNHG